MVIITALVLRVGFIKSLSIQSFKIILILISGGDSGFRSLDGHLNKKPLIVVSYQQIPKIQKPSCAKRKTLK